MSVPSVMPVDRVHWKRQLNLSNFVNTYYQYRDLQAISNYGNILIVGPGQGLEKLVLAWRNYQVTTVDIDPVFEPDLVCSVHDMPMFADQQFDAVVVSHVLEHLPVDYLDLALQEIARVGRYALVYLPVYGLHVQARLRSNWRSFDVAAMLDFLNYWKAPHGNRADYMEGQHYWEVGLRNFRVKDLTKRFSAQFIVLSTYRNKDWFSSQSFILQSRYAESKRPASTK